MDLIQQSQTSAAAVSFDALPLALHMGILFQLPRLVDRVRCALVAKRWAELLRHPTFWAELAFEGANMQHLDNDVIVQLFQRSQGLVRSLDLESCSIEGSSVDFDIDDDGTTLFEALASEGLTARLTSVSLWRGPDDVPCIQSAADARSLRAACPALTSAAVLLRDTWPQVLSFLALLPPAGPKSVRLELIKAPATRAGFAPFANAVCKALADSHIDELEVGPWRPEDGEDADMDADSLDAQVLFQQSAALDPAAAGRAAAKLGAALADPARGPRVLAEWSAAGLCATPAFAHLCRALSPASRLRVLRVESKELSGEIGATETAAALLGPGGCPLEELEVRGCLLDAQRAPTLLIALAANTTLTSLSLESCRIPAAYRLATCAALSYALQRNTTLRSLSLKRTRLDHARPPGAAGALTPLSFASLGALEELDLEESSVGPEAVVQIARALRGGGEAAAAARVRLRVLELGECAVGDAGADALALALLGDPACPLEELGLRSNGIGDAAGTALARAIAQAGQQSRLRLLCLTDNRLGDGAASAFGALLAAQGAAAGAAGPSQAAGCCGRLHNLELCGNAGVGLAGAQALSGGIRAGGAWVEMVTVWPGTDIRAEGAAVLCDAADAWLLRIRAEAEAAGGESRQQDIHGIGLGGALDRSGPAGLRAGSNALSVFAEEEARGRRARSSATALPGLGAIGGMAAIGGAAAAMQLFAILLENNGAAAPAPAL